MSVRQCILVVQQRARRSAVFVVEDEPLFNDLAGRMPQMNVLYQSVAEGQYRQLSGPRRRFVAVEGYLKGRRTIMLLVLHPADLDEVVRVGLATALRVTVNDGRGEQDLFASDFYSTLHIRRSPEVSDVVLEWFGAMANHAVGQDAGIVPMDPRELQRATQRLKSLSVADEARRSVEDTHTLLAESLRLLDVSVSRLVGREQRMEADLRELTSLSKELTDQVAHTWMLLRAQGRGHLDLDLLNSLVSDEYTSTMRTMNAAVKKQVHHLHSVRGLLGQLAQGSTGQSHRSCSHSNSAPIECVININPPDDPSASESNASSTSRRSGSSSEYRRSSSKSSSSIKFTFEKRRFPESVDVPIDPSSESSPEAVDVPIDPSSESSPEAVDVPIDPSSESSPEAGTKQLFYTALDSSPGGALFSTALEPTPARHSVDSLVACDQSMGSAACVGCDQSMGSTAPVGCDQSMGSLARDQTMGSAAPVGCDQSVGSLARDQSMGSAARVGCDQSMGSTAPVGCDQSVSSVSSVACDQSVGSAAPVGCDQSMGSLARDQSMGSAAPVGCDQSVGSVSSVACDQSVGSAAPVGCDQSLGSLARDQSVGSAAPVGCDQSSGSLARDQSMGSAAPVGCDQSVGSAAPVACDLSMGSVASVGCDQSIGSLACDQSVGSAAHGGCDQSMGSLARDQSIGSAAPVGCNQSMGSLACDQSMGSVAPVGYGQSMGSAAVKSHEAQLQVCGGVEVISPPSSCIPQSEFDCDVDIMEKFEAAPRCGIPPETSSIDAPISDHLALETSSSHFVAMARNGSADSLSMSALGSSVASVVSLIEGASRFESKDAASALLERPKPCPTLCDLSSDSSQECWCHANVFAQAYRNRATQPSFNWSLTFGAVDGLDIAGPGNEVLGEEVLGNEVPTNEVPTDEVPTNEVPTNEVPTNEVPTNEVLGNEVRETFLTARSSHEDPDFEALRRAASDEPALDWEETARSLHELTFDCPEKLVLASTESSVSSSDTYRRPGVPPVRLEACVKDFPDPPRSPILFQLSPSGGIPVEVSCPEGDDTVFESTTDSQILVNSVQGRVIVVSQGLQPCFDDSLDVIKLVELAPFEGVQLLTDQGPVLVVNRKPRIPSAYLGQAHDALESSETDRQEDVSAQPAGSLSTSVNSAPAPLPSTNRVPAESLGELMSVKERDLLRRIVHKILEC